MLVEAIPYGDPLTAFAPFADDAVAALLTSAATSTDEGRYSYLAVEPFRVIVADGAGVSVDGVAVDGDAFTVLEGELARFRGRGGQAPVPFSGGAVGFLGYELGRHMERLPAPRLGDLGVPEMVIGLYDVIVAFDHGLRRAWILSNGAPESDPARRVERSRRRAGAVRRRLGPPGTPRPPVAAPTAVNWRPDHDRGAYLERVERVKAYIRAGDIFQANFTQRFIADRPEELTPFALFERLCRLSPAPFAGYLSCGAGLHLLSASPERFLELGVDGRVMTCPVKGTRPRGLTVEEDRRQLEALCVSEKDRAENLMICDLLRNDLGRVCQIGSVVVPHLVVPRSYASVHHLVSVVEGRLRAGLGPIDLLRATFPGGSVTGAPKIRAMEIIHELEPAPRGAYCGAIAWIGFDGAMDSGIVIRTLTLAGNRMVAQAGGGIVADSDPEAEYQEMLIKVQPLLATPGSPCFEHDLA